MKKGRRNNTIIIGTRGSKLALWQAQWIRTAIERVAPSFDVDLEIIKTKGDKILDVPLAKIGGKGLFVKEIEDALLKGRIDLAVHSMKDMPADLPAGLCIGAIPEREIPNDVLISKTGAVFNALEPDACIGTSSLRRASQLRHVRPEITIVPLRGNLDTRLKKLASGEMDAIVLAAAGVKRLDFEDQIAEYLPEDIMLPAVGQGALCVEIRTDDPVIKPIADRLDHPKTNAIVMGERAFLNHLEGGCQVPIAALGKIEHGRFKMTGLVADVDGSLMIKDSHEGAYDRSEQVGVELAERLLSRGAADILKKLRIDYENEKR